MRRTGPGRRIRAVIGVVEREAHPLRHAFQHGHVDAAALPGFAALDQRCKDVGIGIHAGRDVDDRAAGLRRCIGRSGNREQSRLALDQQVVGFLVAIRPVGAVTGDVANDQARKFIPRRGTRCEVLHQHIGAPEQLADNLPGILALQVQRDAFLRTIGPYEMRGKPAHAIIVSPRRIPHPGALYLDHPGTQIRQLPRAKRRRNHMLQSHNRNPIQWPHLSQSNNAFTAEDAEDAEEKQGKRNFELTAFIG